MPSASRVPNSTRVEENASTARQDTLKITKEVGEMLESVPYVKSIAGILVHILKIREDIIANDERCIEILERVGTERDNLIDITKKLGILDHLAAEELGHDLKDYERFDLQFELSRSLSFGRILKDIENVLNSYQNRKGWRATISKTMGRKETAGLLETHARRLDNFHSRFTSTRLVDMTIAMSEARISSLLRRIERIVHFQSDGQQISPCLPNTRLDIFDKIDQWVRMATQASIFLLYGHPGTGKSTISKSLEEKLAQRISGALGAVFFCRRQEGANHSARAFWCQIAAGLMTKHTSIALALASEFQNNFPDVESVPIDVLFDTLIANPIRNGYKDTQPLVFIVDALDEFGGRNPDRRVREEFINSLHHWTRLPSNCHLFITTRQETDIQSLLNNRTSNISTLEVGEHATDQSSQDIRLFFEDRFNQMYQEENPPPQLTSDELASLVKQAAGLFIWARTVTEMVRIDRRFLERAIREHDSLGDLGKLYTDMLLASFPEMEAKDIGLFKKISGTIITAQSPLSLSALSCICQVKESTVIDVFYRRLKPILVIQPTLSFIHKSFEDFLASGACPEKYRFNPRESHQQMSRWCLAILNSPDLHFNMGGLTDSHKMNCDVPDLKEKVPEWVCYSCRWLGAHLASSAFQLNDRDFLPDIQSFFDKNFFPWLEVISIHQFGRYAVEILGSIASSIPVGAFPTSYCNILIHLDKRQHDSAQNKIPDCISFVRTFAQPIFQSYAQIYLSGIPLSPESSLIAKQVNLVKNRLRITQGGLKHWPKSLNTMHGHSSSVYSVAFSPDGQRIVSGSSDKTLRLWDATTGIIIGEPLHGHSDSVRCVAFSPDGKRIVSGSMDKTLRIWDATTGAVIGEPLRGHSDSVRAVAFSPNGQHIVSGSWDKTLRLWDVRTGAVVGNPLQGHSLSVRCIAFSSLGQVIASGSDDNTLRLWDATTGTVIGKPLQGHSDSVSSVAFSPDGQHIVSGSWDKTLRLWNVRTGAVIGRPFHGHCMSVRSVAFSPDGRSIVSGSWDKTLRLWDASTGTMISEILHGHSLSVRSVAFSPDGQRIVSGSEDTTLRLWDGTTGAVIGKLIQGHSLSVRSVAFSPDGKHIVSGSSDKTLRLWNASTGSAIGKPLQGHSSFVNSVAFSPDGHWIVSGSEDSTLRLWNASTGAVIGKPLRGHSSSVNSVAFSPDGRWIVSGSEDSTLRLWDATTGAVIGEPLQGHSLSVRSVAFSPNGQHIVSGSWDKTLRVWNPMTGTTVGKPLHGHCMSVRSVTFSPDGQWIASGSSDKTLRLWNVTTGTVICKPFQDHSLACSSVAFSPDGQQILSGSWDKTLRLWDATSGSVICKPLYGHSSSVNSVAFSPDGKRIISGSEDNTLRLWDATTGSGADNLPTYREPKFPFLQRIQVATAPTSLSALYLKEDGWVVDPDEEFLFWLPPSLRFSIRSNGCINILGGKIMDLDVASFKHGANWTECYQEL
ncbi:quinon protein alcohol dehydrogenase-like superfamily [Flagelloscypha sp. PMI_526]|nr:quinon protein alcohol dehydrogenase-like superfamily [Flagelloscypha sp. PMI_526]